MTTPRNPADAHEDADAAPTRNGSGGRGSGHEASEPVPAADRAGWATGSARAERTGAWTAPSSNAWPPQSRPEDDEPDTDLPAPYPDLRRAVEEPEDDAPAGGEPTGSGRNTRSDPGAAARRPSGGEPGDDDDEDVKPALGEAGYEGWRRPASGETVAPEITAGWRRAAGGASADTEAERGGGAAASAPADGDSAARSERAARNTQGRHAAPSKRRQPGESRRPGDPDDPEGLAGWVGSLVEAVDDKVAIAGRRNGPAPKTAPTERAEAAAEPAAEAAAPVAPWPSAFEPTAEPPSDVRTGPAAGTGEPAAPVAEPRPEPVSEPRPEPARPAAPAPAPVYSGGRVDDDDDDDEYRPTVHDDWEISPLVSRAELIARLDALATMVEISGPDLAPEAARRARRVLEHSGARLRLSGAHTVVALAGGTGSGKSSLFNALSGLELSRVGVTRPTTATTHACTWGDQGAHGLLDWLGVPARNRHSRVSELDKGDSELGGLILLDLPDHDSVRANHTVEAERLIGSVDLVVWVLDPQKYADAAVHHRYLAEMAGHGAVMVAVLNQVDLVEPEELEELLTDLRRLLEVESGVHPRVLTSSTVTDHGIRELRKLLRETVGERRAAIDRLVADLDRATTDFEKYCDDTEAPSALAESVRTALTSGIAESGGVAAVADATETAYEQQGSALVGWPVSRWVGKLRGDPLRSVQLDFMRDDVRGGFTGPIGVQEAGVESAISTATDAVSGELPDPWPRRVRDAARGHSAELPDRLGEAIAGAVPPPDATPSWWQGLRVLQIALVAVAGLSLVWFGVILVSLIGGGLTGMAMLDRPLFLAFAGALFVAALLVGWLVGIACRNLVVVAASQRREEVEVEAGRRVRAIVGEQVIQPLEAELGRYLRYREALRAAKGGGGEAAGTPA